MQRVMWIGGVDARRTSAGVRLRSMILMATNISAVFLQSYHSMERVYCGDFFILAVNATYSDYI